MSALTLRTDSVALAEIFEWAATSARSHRIDGGVIGPLDVSEATPEGRGSAPYEDSYRAGYRHRSGFYLRDFAHQAVGAHLLGWRDRNAAMLAAFVRSADDRHGGWPWWAINFDHTTPLAIDYRSAERFVRELPAVFELAETVNVLHRWTGEPAYAGYGEVVRGIAEDFADAHDRAPRNGVAEALGPGIFDGTASYNELPGVVLHEAGDGFASQYAATRHAAALNRSVDRAASRRLVARADDMRRHYEAKWSRTADRDEVVCGWTDQGEAVIEWSRESTWFPLLKGLLVDARAEGELDRVDRLCRGIESAPRNVEALTYLPDLFFRHGRADLGWEWMRRIHSVRELPHEVVDQGANGAYPEVSFTLLAQIALGILGIEPNGPDRELVLRPGLPDDIGEVELGNVPFGDGTVSVRVARGAGAQECHVQNSTSASLFVGLAPRRGFRDPHIGSAAEVMLEVDPGESVVLSG